MSFTDMMSSGRGPGVIGAVCALIVLLGFGFLFSVASEPGEDRSLESVVRDQGREIETKRGFINSGNASLALTPTRLAEAKEQTRLTLEIETQQKRSAALQAECAAAKTALADGGAAFEGYKNEYRAFVRNKSKGEIIPTLETMSGAVYKNANIREVTAIGIQIRHDDGQKRIPFEELPAEMRDYYQYDPSQKEKAIADESLIREQHEAAVAVSDGKMDEELAKQRAEQAVALKEKKRTDVITKQTQIRTLQNDIRGLEQQIYQAAATASAAKAAGKIHFSKSNTYAGDIQVKKARIATLESEIRQLQK